MMKHNLRILTMLGSILFAYAVSFQTANAQSEPSYQLAPEWTLETQDGQQVSYSDYIGKPMMIHFWGTWCSFCKKLHPGLEKIRLQYEDKGLVVLGISVNEPVGANPANVLKERGIHFLTLVEGDEVATELFGIIGTPTTVFISPKGEILGSTMESNPNDRRFNKVADHLVSLPRG